MWKCNLIFLINVQQVDEIQSSGTSLQKNWPGLHSGQNALISLGVQRSMQHLESSFRKQTCCHSTNHFNWQPQLLTMTMFQVKDWLLPKRNFTELSVWRIWDRTHSVKDCLRRWRVLSPIMQRLAPVSKMACVQKSSILLYTDSDAQDLANGRHLDWKWARRDVSSCGHFLGGVCWQDKDTWGLGTPLNFCLVKFNSEARHSWLMTKMLTGFDGRKFILIFGNHFVGFSRGLEIVPRLLIDHNGQWLKTMEQQVYLSWKPVDTRLSSVPRRRNVGNGFLRYTAKAHHGPLTAFQSSCHDLWKTSLCPSQTRNRDSCVSQQAWTWLRYTRWELHTSRAFLQEILQTHLQTLTQSRRQHHPEQSKHQWTLDRIQLHVDLSFPKHWHRRPCSSDCCGRSETHWKIDYPVTWRPWPRSIPELSTMFQQDAFLVIRIERGLTQVHIRLNLFQCCVACVELDKVGFHPR